MKIGNRTGIEAAIKGGCTEVRTQCKLALGESFAAE